MIPFYEDRKEDLQIIRLNELDFLPHLHAQLELLYLEDGIIETTINSCTRLMRSGDLAVSFPNSVHSYCTPAGQAGMHCLLMIINPPLAGDLTNTLLKWHPGCPFVNKDQLHKDVPYAMDALMSEYVNSGDHSVCSPVCKAYTQIIISRLLQQMELVSNTDADFFDVIYKIIYYINENFTQPLSLKELSRALGVGKYHLSRIFSDKINVSFNNYLNGIRACRARNMLLCTDKNITQIGYDCGFQSTRTFNRAFHKMYGISPREFRHIQETAARKEE